MLMTDGKIIYKPKTRYKYVQGFKGNHEHNEGKNRGSHYISRNYKRANSRWENIYYLE